MTKKTSSSFVITETSGVLADSRKVFNLPDCEYHADVHIQSCSMLKNMAVSPAHYRRALTVTRQPTEKMIFGTVVHLLVLQPHLMLSQTATYPGEKDARCAEYKAFCARNAGRLIVDEPTMHKAELASERILNQSVMGRKFGDFVAEGEAEVSMYYTDPMAGIQCRTRADLLHPEALFDLKTTAYPTIKDWISHARSLSYDMQAYMYLLSERLHSDRATALPFIFMSVENEYPLSTSARRAGESFLLEGKRKYEEALTGIAACSKVDYWPTPGGEETIELEFWQVGRDNGLAWASALEDSAVAKRDEELVF